MAVMDMSEKKHGRLGEAREKNDVNDVCSLIGFKLGNSWEAYVAELHKFP